MINIIKKIFIKDYKNLNNKTVQLRYGVVASFFGVCTNLLLAILKITTGLLSSSMTIASDGINNLSDSVVSVVGMIGFKISAKPADRNHPFGYARFEYIIGLFVVITMIIVGTALALSSIRNIISPSPVHINIWVYLALIFSVCIKTYQYFLYKNFDKAIGGRILKANAADSRNDVVVTFTALLGVFLNEFAHINIDGYTALAISIFIIFSSAQLLSTVVQPLIGEVPDKKTIAQLKASILIQQEVKYISDLIVHYYGKSNIYATVKIHVSTIDHYYLAPRLENIALSYGIKLIVRMTH